MLNQAQHFYNNIGIRVFQVMLVVKNLPTNAGDVRDAGLTPGMGRSPAGGYGNPLQYSCLENPMDRGAWQATIHGVIKNRTRLKQLSTRYGHFNYLSYPNINNDLDK